MSADERDYLLQRAEAELMLAEQAGHPSAARAHALLAGYYLDRIHNRADLAAEAA
jgi:hypothetical protein